MRRHTRAQTQFSCRRTMRPFSIRTERGTSSCQLQCPQENAHSLSAERLPLTASTTSFCLVIAMHAHSPLLSRSSRNEEVVVGCFFFYLFGAVSVSATPGLSDTQVLQPTYTVMTVLVTPLHWHRAVVITVLRSSTRFPNIRQNLGLRKVLFIHWNLGRIKCNSLG